MNPGEEDAYWKDVADCLAWMQKAGWISGYDLSRGLNPDSLAWTEKGRFRAAQLVEIDGEIGPNAEGWVMLASMCRFAGPDKTKDGLN